MQHLKIHGLLAATALLAPLTAVSALKAEPELALEQIEQYTDPSRIAADARLLAAPIPDWVEIAEIPAEQTAATRGLAASQAVHSDQYMITDAGGIAYQRTVYRISDRSALEDYGTMSIEWEPARSKATLHRFNIIRGDETINVVERQGDFALFRREANLAEGILDGQITASLQIEDLRVGDVLEFAYSIETEYAPMTGHYQNWHYFAGRTQADRLVQRVVWPKDKFVNVIVGKEMPEMPIKTRGQYKMRGFTQDAVDWQEMPKNLLARYYRERAFEISTFADWNQLAETFRPVYEQAITIPATGPLRQYVEGIRGENLSQRAMAEKVLTMVQGDIRYVGNFQGLGNYTPASAESVWASKFGDCKGKTILLVAILRELGIDATPSLVNADGNDSLETTIAMPGWFNHVFARVRIDGETYWLDGTRLDDTSLDLLAPVFYDYTLPLEPDSDLIVLTDNEYSRPQSVTTMTIDNSAGFDEPAKVNMVFTVHDDAALTFINGIEKTSEAERERKIEQIFKASQDDDFQINDVDFTFSKADKVAAIIVNGQMPMEWGAAEDFKELLLDDMNIGQNFYRERDEEDYAGYSDTPLWTDASYTVSNVELILPETSAVVEISGDNYDTKFGPASYVRKVEQDGNIVRAFSSVKVARGPYLPEAAKKWDEKTDDLFDDKVYVSVFGDDAAATRVANYDQVIEQAQSLATDGKMQAASNILNPLIDSDPNNVKLLVARANMGGSASLRERDLLRALLLEPTNMKALRSTAELYMEQDNVSLGKAMLQRMISKDKEHVWAKEQLEEIKTRAKGETAAD